MTQGGNFVIIGTKVTPYQLQHDFRVYDYLLYCYFPMWYPGSGVVLDCIVSWSLPSFLLSSNYKVRIDSFVDFHMMLWYWDLLTLRRRESLVSYETSTILTKKKFLWLFLVDKQSNILFESILSPVFQWDKKLHGQKNRRYWKLHAKQYFTLPDINPEKSATSTDIELQPKCYHTFCISSHWTRHFTNILWNNFRVKAIGCGHRIKGSNLWSPLVTTTLWSWLNYTLHTSSNLENIRLKLNIGWTWNSMYNPITLNCDLGLEIAWLSYVFCTHSHWAEHLIKV